MPTMMQAGPPSNQNDLRRLLSLVPYISGKAADQDLIGTFGLSLFKMAAATANGEFSVIHPLNRIPVGYIVIRTSAGGVVYDPADGSARWTSKQIILRDTVASDVVSLILL